MVILDCESREMEAQQALLEKSAQLAARARTPTASHTVHIPANDLAKRQEECLATWENLKTVQTELVDSRKLEPAGPDDGSEITILKAKVKLLEGTTQAYKDAPCLALPDSVAVQQQILLSDLEKSLSELYDILSYVKAQRQMTRESLERETALGLEREQIHDELTRRLEAVRAAQSPHQIRDRPTSSVIAEAHRKLEHANAYKRKLMRLIGRFVEEHFPPPSAEVKKWAKKRKLPASTGAVFSLQDVIGELMNKGVTADPYVQTDARYWPSYIQLLVRTGVAQKDPSDDTRVKMTPFHK